jgi:hypothetical protein
MLPRHSPETRDSAEFRDQQRPKVVSNQQACWCEWDTPGLLK